MSESCSAHSDSKSRTSKFDKKGSLEIPFKIDLGNWMSNLPDRLINTPLVHLAIPGSHNSFSYSITPSSFVSSDSPRMIQYLGKSKLLKPFSRRFIYNWCKGQKLDVVQQLNSGIRYFDIRLVKKDDDIYVAHGMLGEKIWPLLKQLNEFLCQHPREVVFLDFQHFYDIYIEDHEKIKTALFSIFRDKICLRSRKMIENTLSLFWQNNLQVLIIYRNIVTSTTHAFWPSSTWITDWPNEVKVDKLLVYLNNSLAEKKREAGHVSQGVLTATPGYMFFHMVGGLKSLAPKVNKEILSWLETKGCGANGVNVVLCDYVDECKFSSKVILLNYS